MEAVLMIDDPFSRCGSAACERKEGSINVRAEGAIEFFLGEVFGLTVRSRNLGAQFGSAFKSLAGGELRGMTKNLQASREEVIERLTAEAEARGANCVLAMRFDTSAMGGNWTEICAYGTAVRAIRRS